MHSIKTISIFEFQDNQKQSNYEEHNFLQFVYFIPSHFIGACILDDRVRLDDYSVWDGGSGIIINYV